MKLDLTPIRSSYVAPSFDSDERPIFQEITHYPQTRATGNGCHEHAPLKLEDSSRG